jgi:GNAT superfamily N-acetyltransferase
MIEIRDARPGEADELTVIAHASKAHWGYPQEWIEMWRDDLTVTEDFLAEHLVLVAESEGRLVGFSAVVGDGEQRELDGLFVVPGSLRQGIGKQLLAVAIARVRPEGVQALRIVSDPHAEAFYKSQGAVWIGEQPSVPQGRKLPVLRLELGRLELG